MTAAIIKLAPESADAKQLASFTLEQTLEKLLKFGKPRLCFTGDMGWYCCVEMSTNALGSEFKVASALQHPTPIAAALQCLGRTITAVAALGGAA